MTKLDVFKGCSGGVAGGLCSILRNRCSRISGFFLAESFVSFE